ncbi:MAG: MbnP family protein [Saprospiraceae bacterium]|nr:MbnP family protein [Saprospiraceae bacterium]
MNKLKIFFSILIVGLLFSCSDSDEDSSPTITVNYKAVYGNNPLVLNEDVWFFNDETMTFSKLNLFISDLTLKGQNGDQLLSDVEFVTFETSNRTEDGAAEGMSQTFDAEVGDYNGISFGIGVSPVLNSLPPSEYDSDHVLGQFGAYWAAWNSFIFSKTEGMIDSDGDDEPDLAFVYHAGADKMYRVKTVNTDISVLDGEEVEIDVIIDYKRVFGEMDDHIDILNNPTFHSPQDTALAELTQQLPENFLSAITVEVQ